MLTKGMFGSEFGKRVATPFELFTGQMVAVDKLAHNAGWYNQLGEKLGWGDLSHGDLFRIQRHLNPGEAFVILSESDSFWNFVDKIGVIGADCSVKPTAEAPGVEYVSEKARFIVTTTKMYWVDTYEDRKDKEFSREGVIFHVINRYATRPIIENPG